MFTFSKPYHSITKFTISKPVSWSNPFLR